MLPWWHGLSDWQVYQVQPKEGTRKHMIKLFIGVLSTPSRRAARDAQRQSWMSQHMGHHVVRFMIGSAGLTPHQSQALHHVLNRIQRRVCDTLMSGIGERGGSAALGPGRIISRVVYLPASLAIDQWLMLAQYSK